MIVEGALNVFTDGSSYSGPRAGGVGIRFVHVDEAFEEKIIDVSVPGYKQATNNQMEIQACITALAGATRLSVFSMFSKIVIHTDSLYVTQNVGKAIFVWPKTKWLLQTGKPVLNADLWKELVKKIKGSGKRVEFQWVKGHSKNLHNRAADKLAKSSARNPLNAPLTIVESRRKRTSHTVSIGSVHMLGQRVSIRIVTAEYLRVQNVHKYKFEVITRKSPFYGKVDIAYSQHSLRAAHSYLVAFNSDQKNPRIANVLREVGKRKEQTENMNFEVVNAGEILKETCQA
jgi:ribonuclease HI